MSALVPQPIAAANLGKSGHAATAGQRHVRALLISPQLEVRKILLRSLETLATDVICCLSRVQAAEVLSRQSLDIIFCDEHLPDGSYEDLIHTDNYDRKIPRVVVVTHLGEWELYFEALRKGAFDVIRSPWYPTDIEMTLIRALREEEAAHSAAPQLGRH